MDFMEVHQPHKIVCRIACVCMYLWPVSLSAHQRGMLLKIVKNQQKTRPWFESSKNSVRVLRTWADSRFARPFLWPGSPGASSSLSEFFEAVPAIKYFWYSGKINRKLERSVFRNCIWKSITGKQFQCFQEMVKGICDRKKAKSKKKERRLNQFYNYVYMCVCVCVCIYIYVMVIHAGICLPNHISGIFLNSTNFRYSLLLDLMPDQCGPVFESEKMGNTTSSSIVCVFLLHIFVLPSFSKLF